MLNIFNMATAINEASTGGHNNSISAFDFGGTINEAFYDFREMALIESNIFKEFTTGADEIMLEASINNPAALEVIYESAFTTIKEGFLKFIQKMIGWFKGIGNKIKAFFTSRDKTVKTGIEMAKSVVEKAKDSPINTTFKMHDWNFDYLFKNMLNAIAVSADHFSDIKNSVKDMLGSIKDKDTTMSNYTKSQIINDFSSDFGVSGSFSDESELIDAVKHKLYNGKPDDMIEIKVDRTVLPKYVSALEATTADNAKDISTTIDKIVKDLQECHSMVQRDNDNLKDDSGSDGKGLMPYNNKGVDTGSSSKYENKKNMYNDIMKTISVLQNIFNRIENLTVYAYKTIQSECTALFSMCNSTLGKSKK